MEMSNFAHVIFQNMGKSYLPHAALECHYTLTQFLKPHQKDWVGIFKVGWSTARDYYTFLWSPLPDNYTEGTAVNRSVIFQGYYVPNDDGEFYQFCYVTHKGEIRGASTPFQFRANSPSEEELLTVEDEGNSDILVVTTKASYLEQKMEEMRSETEELQRSMELLQKERDGLMEEKEKLQRECEQERESSAKLKREIQDLQLSYQSLQEEKEEVKRMLEEKTARLLQLEEDLIGVTQKGLQRETELDCLKDRLKKLSLEKDALESQLKNEKDEKELYKIHLKNRELENTKLSAELQMLKSVDVNKENTIAQLKEELGRLKACLTEKDKQHRELLANSSPLGESKALKEQLRQKEEQLQATQQQANLLSAELRDSSNTRDRSMADLYRARLEMDELRKGRADAQAKCSRLEQDLEQLNTVQQQASAAAESGVAELQREVEDLKLRLQMAAEHYKEKYKECQRLQKQVAKLSEQQGVKRSPGNEAAVGPLSTSPDAYVPGSPGSSDAMLDNIIQGKLKVMNKEASERSEKYRKCKQMLSKLQESVCREDEEEDNDGSLDVQVFLQYPLPYSQDAPSPLLVPQRPTDLMFGNPYASSDTRDGADGEFSDEQIARLPPVGPPSWDSNVVCIQPARNLSRPDGLEEPEEEQQTNQVNANDQPAASDPQSNFLNDGQMPFCFEPSSGELQKRCPLCEVIFPPHYDQSKFEEHVESHWKICPMCSEQFPLDCDQDLFEKHVLTHFDGNVLNFT